MKADAMTQLGAGWALKPPKNCPKCRGRVREFFINFELDKVGKVPVLSESEVFDICLVCRL